ncbi:LCP family protein [Microbacterium fluvii]|uniref:LCP family protein n=1 Tax=Microbacterium fluvii TaxID=415215 RepID=A0ABW2H8V6_9MICO|nr:LCP family protein [Microbacterium fluvii]MCU4671412.1 LCP family protein [Microbacterium fluvii]
MSVSAPSRPAARTVRRPLVEERPLRHPDLTSPQVMTRRGWWLVVLNFLFPGSAQAVAGNRRLAKIGLGATLAMWALIALAVVSAMLWRQALVAFATNWFVLLAAQVLLIGYAILWVVLTIDTLRLVTLVRTGRIARFGIAVTAIVLMVVSGGTAAYASTVAGSTRDALGAIFGASGPSVPPSDGYYNILLLGADSAKGRDHMLFDSISVVSVNADTGAVTITGIPRDMRNVPFSEGPMQDLYPNGHEGHSDAYCGWDNKINQLNTEVGQCMDGEAMYPDAAANGSTPGIEATKDAAEGVLGIEIPYYVFIDMDGFAALIDALGGVDITVDERLPTGAIHQNADGSLSGVKGWIEVGEQHMDGDTAQWYARSRYTTSDWSRMQRQRQLQQAILAQFTPANVLTRFQSIAAAGTEIVNTDIPQDLIPYLSELALKAKEQKVTTIELVYESAGGIGVDPDDPDFDFIHSYLDGVLHPPTPTATPEG